MNTGSPSATSLKGKGGCGVRKLAAYCGPFMCYKAQSIQTSPQNWITQSVRFLQQEQVNHQCSNRPYSSCACTSAKNRENIATHLVANLWTRIVVWCCKTDMLMKGACNIGVLAKVMCVTANCSPPAWPRHCAQRKDVGAEAGLLAHRSVAAAGQRRSIVHEMFLDLTAHCRICDIIVCWGDKSRTMKAIAPEGNTILLSMAFCAVVTVTARNMRNSLQMHRAMPVSSDEVNVGSGNV